MNLTAILNGTNISDSNNITMVTGNSNGVPASRILYGCAIAVLALCGILGNALTVITIARYKDLHKSQNLFVASLATADFLLVSSAFPMAISSIISNKWIFSSTACNFMAIITTTSSLVTLMSLCAIAFYRYRSITKMVHNATNIKTRRTWIVITVIWILAVLTSFIPVLPIPGVTYSYNSKLFVCIIELGAEEGVIWSVVSAVGYGLTQFVLLASYLRILHVIHQSKRRIQAHKLNSESAVTTVTDDHKLTIQVFIIYLLFNICWSPFMITQFLIAPFHEINGSVHQVVLLLIIFDSVCNPFVYFYLNKSFRNYVKLSLRCNRSSS